MLLTTALYDSLASVKQLASSVEVVVACNAAAGSTYHFRTRGETLQGFFFLHFNVLESVVFFQPLLYLINFILKIFFVYF